MGLGSEARRFCTRLDCNRAGYNSQLLFDHKSGTSRLPVGTVYAVFTGLGTGGTVVGEMLLFGEPFQWSKTLLIALLLAGVVGLKLVTDRDAQEGSGA